MARRKSIVRRKRAAKAQLKAQRFYVPHLVIAAGILVALVASVPLGAYFKASVVQTSLIAQDGGMPPPPPPPPPPSGDMQQPPPTGTMPPPPTGTMPPPPTGTMPPPPTGSTNTIWCPAQNRFVNTALECGPAPTGTNTTGTYTPPANMPPCAAGQMPTAAAPCMMSGSGTGTYTPSANMPQCDWSTQYVKMSTMACMPKTACQTQGSAEYNTQECQGVRGMPAAGMQPNNMQPTGTMTTPPPGMTACPPNTQPTSANPCWVPPQQTQQWQQPQTQQQTGDCWNSQGPNFASASCTAERAKVNDTKGMNQFPTGMPCPANTQPSPANPCIPSGMNQFPGQNNQFPGQNGFPSANGPFPGPMNGPFPFPTNQFPQPDFSNFNFGSMGPGMNGPNGMNGPDGMQQPQDFNKMYQDAGPFKNFDYGKQFDQFKINVDTTQQADFSAMKKKSEIKRLMREAKDARKAWKQMNTEFERATKRAANLTTCPPIATAKAALASSDEVIKLLESLNENSDDATVKNAVATEQQFGFGGPMGGPGMGGPGFGGPGMGGPGFGGPGMGGPGFGGPGMGGPGFGGPGMGGPNDFGPQSNAGSNLVAQAGEWDVINPSDFLWPKTMMAVGQSHMCEGLVFVVKDLGRLQKEIANAKVKVRNTDVLDALTELEKTVADESNNIYSKVDFENMEPGMDPMQDVMMTMQDLRQQFGDIMQNAFSSQQEEAVCGVIQQIDAATSQVKGLPAGFVTSFAKARAACQAGDVQAANDVMFDLEQYKDQVEQLMEDQGISFDENDNPDQTTAEANPFAGLSKEDIVAKLLNDPEIAQKIADKFLGKIQEKATELAKAMANQQISELTQRVAQLESKLASSQDILGKQANVLATASAMPEDKLQAYSAAAQSAADVVGELDARVNTVAKDLSPAVQNSYKDLVVMMTARITTPEARLEMTKQVDAVVSAAQTATDAKELAATLKTEIPQAQAAVQALITADAKNVVKEGYLPFNDLVGNEGHWAAQDTIAAAQRGLVKGENGNVNLDRTINTAEAMTIIGRAIAGGDTALASVTPDMSNPIVAKAPEWARPAVTALAEHGVNLGAVTEGKNFDAAMTREQMFQLASQAFDLKASGSADDVLAKFSDAGKMNPEAQVAAAALVEMGVVSGQGGTGSIDPNGVLNRAAFLKITNRVIDQTAPVGLGTPQTDVGPEASDQR